MNNLIIILCDVVSIIYLCAAIYKDEPVLFVVSSMWICTALILTKLQ